MAGEVKLTKRQIEELRRADEIYYPCDFGVHVCGDKDGAAATFGNVEARNEEEARRAFAACKAEAECQGDEPHDFCVDLNLGRYNAHVDDFWMSHQMLERCLAAGRAALKSGGIDHE